MNPSVHEWLNLIVRWVHVVAGIMWIGDSFLFMWLDSHLSEPREPKAGVSGELWMVHSGGFYQVEKLPFLRPEQMPRTLYWFKWEAGLTWLSGFLLLIIVYYMSGGVYLIDPSVAKIGIGTAAGIGLALLVVGWFVYDGIWSSPLARAPRATALLCFALVVGVAFGLTHLLSGRAAFIHVGAMLGTIMAANVWLRILPAQRALLAATRAGTTPDLALGQRAKMRSTHNHYITLPLIFIMLSNHFPSTYGNAHAWLLLALMIVAGVGMKLFMNARNRSTPFVLGAVAASITVAFVMTAHSRHAVARRASAARASDVSFAEAQAIVEQRCLPCHSPHPSEPGFSAPPLGVTFTSPQNMKRFAARIKTRAVVLKTMPLGNATHITPQERQLLGMWVDEGAPTH